MAEMPDFQRSFIYYTTVNHPIWVRIQIDCRCQVIDRATGATDEYVLSVRTQTGLRDIPIDESHDPGYDFWFIFGKDHVFTRREHTSTYNNNPTVVTAADGIFVER